MCAECENAVREQDCDRLEEVAANEETHRWLTKCVACGQLWTTNAYQPQYSWAVSAEEAERSFPVKPTK